MAITQFDFILRGGALSLLMLLAALLVRDHRAALPARMAVGLIFGVGCSVIGEGIGMINIPAPVGTILLLGEASISGFFWLFVRSWFDDEVRFGWRSWVMMGVLLGVSLANFILWTPQRGSFPYTDIPMRTLWLGLAIAALWVAWRGRENDLVEARRRVRTGFVWATGGAVVVINLIYYTLNITSPFQISRIMALTISFTIIIIVGGICYAMLGVRRADIFVGPQISPPAEHPADDPAHVGIAARLQTHMAQTRAYRDDTLTIAGLAAQLGEQEYRLRRVINGQMGYRNFAAFLNGYRLAEVKAALTDPTQREVPILTIALDAGFGSLGPFNRAFREAEGMTPSAYRAGVVAA
jgi:AraC-like DNA-binding protein